jgi:hypothetical protein
MWLLYWEKFTQFSIDKVLLLLCIMEIVNKDKINKYIKRGIMKKNFNMSEIRSKSYWTMDREEKEALKEWRKNRCVNKRWLFSFLEERFLGDVYLAHIPMGFIGVVIKICQIKICQIKICSHNSLRDMGGCILDDDPNTLSVPHICTCCGTSVIVKKPIN